MLAGYKGKMNKAVIVNVLVMHIDGCDLSVSVGGVVVDTPVSVAAGGIYCDLHSFLIDAAATSCLADGSKNVEKLTDAVICVDIGNRMIPCECGTDKAGL